jgi:hypothetical protein
MVFFVAHLLYSFSMLHQATEFSSMPSRNFAAGEAVMICRSICICKRDNAFAIARALTTVDSTASLSDAGFAGPFRP